ncbi:prolyl oligopeptidase family serine peptidase [Spirosoma sp.]|uniref:alpha/beta hydrolase family protein n=1 Tax=Spirosoma sp. TaxID=1899569 RepID=UPI002633167A|nr:prolyl oligopeptidase family serine peptidase [Spirosoma sp.]MCX6212984.1 prolyl oligopeptidase family serine peptidase [Spirosoma sp.]
MKNSGIFILILWWASLTQGMSQEQQTYKIPAPAIKSVLDAPIMPGIWVNGTGDYALLMPRPTLWPLSMLNRPEIRLAGLRFNPDWFGASRLNFSTSLRILTLPSGKTIDVQGIPKGAVMDHISWSPDNRKVAFCVYTEHRVEVWVTEVTKPTARRVSALKPNSLFGTPFEWLNDSRHLLLQVAAYANRPTPNPSQLMPTIQEHNGQANPTRTYPGLLHNEHDNQLFEHFATSQLIILDLDGRKTAQIGTPALITSANSSPDGRFILIKSIHRPFSYTVPWNRFPHKVQIFTSQGKLVKTLLESPIAESILPGRDAVSTLAREHNWRTDAPATLCWVEALDGGNPTQQIMFRDKVLVLEAPFSGQPTQIHRCTYRFNGILWGNDTLAIVQERWWSTRQATASVIKLKGGPAEVYKVADYSLTDLYQYPGDFELNRNKYGRYTLDITKDGYVYITGTRVAAQDNIPFINKLNLQTNVISKVWQNTKGSYEQPIAFLDSDKASVLVSRESPEEYPNYYLYDLRKGSYQQLTNWPHPYPQWKNVRTERITALRKDSITLNAQLYLPVGYRPEMGPLPTVFWGYPVEYKRKTDASQFSNEGRRFTYLPTLPPILLVLQGYAVLVAAMPLVGEGAISPNDTYLEQLTLNAQTILQAAAKSKLVDTSRVAVAGHSYGAAMAANLLTHTHLFKTGIALSGAYNRTLTPFGFQAEERHYWQVPELYNHVSPFQNSHQLTYPILLIHGEADSNPGTFPIQTERYFQALKGLGKTVRYVSLPKEDHGYQARESMYHVFWEITSWLDKFLKTPEVSLLPVNTK